MRRVCVSRSPSPRSARSGQSYLSFFSRLPSMFHSRFSPPNSAAPFPLNLSPSIVRVYSTVIVLSMIFRSAENVSFPSLNFGSLIFSSFWSGQFIVPTNLSPAFLSVRVDVRFCPPISYSHCHVPTGFAFSSRAPARPQSPSTIAAERIAFMRASEERGQKQFGTNRHLPLTAIIGRRAYGSRVRGDRLRNAVDSANSAEKAFIHA